jgi:hypothetical protein
MVVFDIGARAFTSAEKKFILDTLYRGWPLSPNGYHVSLQNQRDIDSVPGMLGLSMTNMQTKQIFFSLENWERVPAPLQSIYTIKEYRTYLVLHEFGHALGLGHRPKALGPDAPIMMQQTLGLKGLRPNVWPLPYEIAALLKKYK